MQHNNTRIYSSESAFKSWASFRSLFFDNWSQAVYLGKQIAFRDLKTKYRQTILGFAWLFIPVLITTALFVFMNHYKVINAGETVLPYFLYAFTGTLFWQLFSESVLSPMQIFNQSKAMITKIQFPKEALIIASGVQIMVNFMVKLAVVLPVVWLMGYGMEWSVLLVPVAALALIFLGLLIGLLLTPLNMLYNDVLMAVQSLLTLLVFTVPAGFKPAEGSSLESVMNANPLSIVISSARDFLTTGWDGHHDALMNIIALIGVASILYFMAFLIIRTILPIVTERLSA